MLQKPKQKRSLDRINKILDASDALLIEGNISSLSIARVSQRAELKRTSTYKFFPTTDSLKAMMIKMYLKDCENIFRNDLKPIETDQISVIVLKTVEVFYDFFIGSEAAQLIILKNTVSPPISSESINDLGSSVESFIDSNVSLPEMYNKSGVYRVLVQLILSVFSLNAKENGTLNEVGRIEAHRAGQSYLLNWISQSS